MEPWVQTFLTIIGSVLASSGFWAFMNRKTERSNARDDILIGLAHAKIMELGVAYIERGWVTQEEYENLYDYIYVPYEKMGGNGSAKKIMDEVTKLPTHHSKYEEE